MASDNSRFKEAIALMEGERDKNGLVLEDGRRYSMVKSRVEVFRKLFGSEFGIRTKVDYSNGVTRGAVIVAHAEIIDENSRVMASGHAAEFVGSNDITTTSPIEAAETSAIGRALACFGLHGGEYASGNEMQAIPRKTEARRERDTPISAAKVDKIEDELNPRFPPIPDDGMRLYVPTGNDPVEREVSLVTDEIARIDSRNKLSRYWTELREFRSYLAETDPELDGELKAAFATANRIIKE